MLRVWLAFIATLASMVSIAQSEKPRLVVPTGHTNGISRAVYSPDGSRILSGAWDNTARLWDARTGRELLKFEGHEAIVWNLSFSPDGKRVATAGFDQTARIWDAATGKLRFKLGGDLLFVYSAQFSPDGTKLATSSMNGAAQLWDAATGRLLRTFEGHLMPVSSVAFSPDGQRIATASWDGTARIWDVGSGKQLAVLKGHTESVTSVAYSSDGTRIATCAQDKTVRVWKAADGSPLFALAGASGWLNSVAISPNGLQIAAGCNDENAYIWNLATRQLERQLQGHSGNVASVAYSPDGAKLLTASEDNTMIEWDAATGAKLRQLGRMTFGVVAASFGVDSHRLVTASGDGSARTWRWGDDRTTNRVVGPNRFAWFATVSSDGARITNGIGTTEVANWQIADGKGVRSVAVGKSLTPCAVESPDGSVVAVASDDKSVGVYELGTGKKLFGLIGHGDAVLSVAFSSDGGRIAGGSADGSARVWDAKTGALVSVCAAPPPSGPMAALQPTKANAVNGVKFSPDGKTVAGACQYADVVLWDAATGKLKASLIGHSGIALVCAFSPDGSKLASGGFDRDVIVWDVPTAKEVVRIRGHEGAVIGVAFSRDGKTVATASRDGTARLWSATSGRELSALIPFGEEWVVTTPDGYFDASPGALKAMYWVLPGSLETIDLDQVKTGYWRPGLLGDVMSGRTLPAPPPFPIDQLQPTAEIVPPKPGGTVAKLRIHRRSGGVGAVGVTVNSAPVPLKFDLDALNANQDSEIEVDLKGFLDPNRKNVIEASVANRTGTIAGRSANAGEVPPAPAAGPPPKLFVLAIGTGDYRGELPALNLPPKDARDFAAAMRMAGGRLFGDRVQVELLTTETNPAPIAGVSVGEASRSNIAAAIERIEKAAQPQDGVVLFFAGHGVSIPQGQQRLYCYLTREATTGSEQTLQSPELRARVAISMDDLKAWMVPSFDGKHGIRAQRRVLILDTCASGQAVANLTVTRDFAQDSVKTLDAFKDATGFWVLAGSAADAVSYEASQFGQGMLTYGLLLGMKSRLDPASDQLDVERLFSFASRTVEELVRNVLGGIQKPQILRTNQTFPIGALTESDRQSIPLASPRRRILRPRTFTNTDPADPDDSLKITEQLRALLGKQNAVSLRSGSTWYVDAEDLAGGIVASGNYRIEAGKVVVSFVLKVDGKAIAPVQTVAGTLEEAKTGVLAQRILDLVNKIAIG